MKIIKSNQNQMIKYYKSLLLKKNRIKYSQFLIEGFHLCQMAQEANLLQEVILTKNTKFNFDKKVFVTEKIIKSLCDAKNPQPIVGIAKLQHQQELIKDKNVLVIDDIQEPGNLGAILRSAVAFDFNNIVLSLNTVDLYNPKTLRSAQGANFKLNIIKKDLKEFLSKFKGHIIATDLSKISINKNKLKTLNGPKCLIIGNEGNGIRKEISDLASNNFIIDIKNVDSLNVAVAASILMEKLK